MPWKPFLSKAGSDVDDLFDRLRARLDARLNQPRELLIVPYRGYATSRTAHLRGRVLRNPHITPATDSSTSWDNLRASYRRYGSHEVSGAPLTVTFGTQTLSAVTDHEGYFAAEVTTPEDGWRRSEGTHWRPYVCRIAAAPELEPVRATGEALVVGRDAEFGVISDIDDTVLVTRATNLLAAARLTLLGNAHSRLPFPGVAELYQALQSGTGGSPRNPIFYVSSNAWNLYQLLVDFMALNGLPAGPLFLQDYGLDRNKLVVQEHRRHKLAQIHRILTVFPDLPFVLVGDSGQRDAEIYVQVAVDFPGRVRAIYIRDVTDSPDDARMQLFGRRVGELGVPMVLAADSLVMARHAASLGLIDSAQVAVVEEAAK